MSKPLSEKEWREKIAIFIESGVRAHVAHNTTPNEAHKALFESELEAIKDMVINLILQDRKAWGELWYIVTEFGGPVVLGGFETKELALEVRQWLENRMNGKTYAIEQRQRNQGEKTDE